MPNPTTFGEPTVPITLNLPLNQLPQPTQPVAATTPANPQPEPQPKAEKIPHARYYLFPWKTEK